MFQGSLCCSVLENSVVPFLASHSSIVVQVTVVIQE